MKLISRFNQIVQQNKELAAANLEYLYLQFPPTEVVIERADRRVYFVGMFVTALLPALSMAYVW